MRMISNTTNSKCVRKLNIHKNSYAQRVNKIMIINFPKFSLIHYLFTNPPFLSPFPYPQKFQSSINHKNNVLAKEIYFLTLRTCFGLKLNNYCRFRPCFLLFVMRLTITYILFNTGFFYREH